MWIKPGDKVLYLGAASGTTISHVSYLVGPDGVVYAAEFSHRSGRDLMNMAEKRTNVIPIIEDARHPLKYRMLVGMVDDIVSDVCSAWSGKNFGSQCIILLEIRWSLCHFSQDKLYRLHCAGGGCIFPGSKKLHENQLEPSEKVTLEPFERDHACIVGGYRMPMKPKAAA